MTSGQSSIAQDGSLSTSITLLQRLSSGANEQDWRRFVDLYSPFLYRWISSAGLQDSDARDAVQNVLLTVMTKLPTFQYDPSRKFRAWLWKIAINAARLSFRKRKVAGRGTGDGGLSGVISEESLSMFWDREYATHVTARALQIMQAEFQETTWRACWEQVVNDRPAAAVAAELGISPGACYIAKSRVLARLRDVLGDML